MTGFPKVDLTIEDNYLGVGIKGLKGVLRNMSISHGHNEELTTVTVEIALSSIKIDGKELRSTNGEAFVELERFLSF